MRALRVIRRRRRLSLRAMATAVGVPLSTVQALLGGPAVTEDAVARIRAFLEVPDT